MTDPSMKKVTLKSSKSRPARNPRRRSVLKERKSPGCKVVEFPDMKGRKLEKVEIYTFGVRHSIVIEFQDKTALDLAIEPGFTLRAVQEDRQPGNPKIIRRWAPVYSEP